MGQNPAINECTLLFQAIVPAISSAKTMTPDLTDMLTGTLNKMMTKEREDMSYPPTGNPLAAFVYCTSME